MIMEILNICMTKECRVWTIKDNHRLGEDIENKVLAFAFSLSAEIEQNLISQRTREALVRKRAEGVILGRPKGSSCKNSYKLYKKENLLREMMSDGLSYCEILRVLKVHRNTMSNYIKKFMPV